MGHRCPWGRPSVCVHERWNPLTFFFSRNLKRTVWSSYSSRKVNLKVMLFSHSNMCRTRTPYVIVPGIFDSHLPSFEDFAPRTRRSVDTMAVLACRIMRCLFIARTVAFPHSRNLIARQRDINTRSHSIR